MDVTAERVRKLRDATGAGIMDCKRALAETRGEFEKAIVWLRERGIAKAAKRADRDAREGAVASYIHMGGKVGVLVEVNCETDFVARNARFQELCKDICLQVCSAAPKWIRREDVPAELVEAERHIYKRQAAELGKPAPMCEKIAEGRLNKWFQEVCLLEQPFIKDSARTMEEVIKEFSGTVGEKIEVRRFSRFERGEALES